MKKALALSVLMLVTVTGCTQPQPPQQDAIVDEGPTIDPGPIELSVEEAAERYLNLVCQGNVAGTQLWQAISAGEDEFLNGGAPPVDSIHAAATEVVRIDRQGIELIDDDYYVWPEAVAEQLPLLRSLDMAHLSTNQSLINITTFEEAYYSSYPEGTAEQTAAAQEIRYQLQLDPDTTASCVGFETGNDALYQEMLERNELLEEQAAREAEEAE